MSQLTHALSQIIRSTDPKAEAERLLAATALAKRKVRSARRAKAKVLRLPGKSKATKRHVARERMERMAEIRLALHVETCGLCAVCCGLLPFGLMHAHHILSGPERQTEERKETMAPVHERCHDALHGKDPKWMDQLDALRRLLEWCEGTDRVEAAESTRHRIARIEEARRPTPGEERR